MKVKEEMIKYLTESSDLSSYVIAGQMSAFFIDYMGVVTVKSFGVVGDGVVDDTDNLQNAIDFAIASSHHLLYFPHGEYVNTGLTDTTSLTFLGDNASLTGTTYTITDWGSVIVQSDIDDWEISMIYGVKW